MARIIGPSSKIKNNLKQLYYLITDLKSSKTDQKISYNIRLARVYMYETVNLLNDNEEKLSENLKETCVRRLTKYQKELQIYSILQSRRQFSLKEAEIV